jgi:hypothetical protein
LFVALFAHQSRLRPIGVAEVTATGGASVWRVSAAVAGGGASGSTAAATAAVDDDAADGNDDDDDDDDDAVTVSHISSNGVILAALSALDSALLCPRDRRWWPLVRRYAPRTARGNAFHF